MIAATEGNEGERLEALRQLDLLDTENEPEFDELVALAAAVCDVPMSAVGLMDSTREWLKAVFGLPPGEAPRELAFCNHTIQQTDALVVEDTHNDARFAGSPFVTGGPHLRFYAGMPVTSPDGHAVGALCVMDKKPHKLSANQITALKLLAREVDVRFELRMERKKLQQALQEAEEAHAKLRASEERFRLFMDNSPLVAHMKDSEYRLVFYNQRYADRFGITREEWLGKTNFDLYPPEQAGIYQEQDTEVLQGRRIADIAQTVQERDGTTSFWRSCKFPLVGSDGSCMVGVVGIEITEDLRREEELHRSQKALEDANHLLQAMVRTDALTGLHNRRGFDERLKVEFALAKRKKRALSVLLLDVDNFKRRNDRYGHAEGDAALKQLAEVLQQTVRIADLTARYGGEEFVVLLPETDEAQALQFAGRLMAAIHAQKWAHELLTASMGVATLHPSTPNETRLVTLADEALYAAKRAGKDRAVGYGAYLQQMMQEISGSKPVAEHAAA